MKTLSLGNNMSYFMWDTENYFNLEYIKFKNANFTLNKPMTVNSLNCEYDGSDNTQDSSLFTISDSLASFTSNGKNTFSNFVKAKNGGIFNIGDSRYADNNELHLNSDTFNNNASSEKGGAIAYMGYQNVIGDHNILEVEATSFNNNKSANGGAVNNYGTATITNSEFTENTATKKGGAIANSGNLNLDGTTFTKNNAITMGYGGAIAHVKGTTTVKNSIFKENKSYKLGGAIYAEEGTLTVENTEFTGNKISYSGGAISTGEDSSKNILIDIKNSIFKNNTANEFAGAIYNNGGDVTITNTDFIENTAIGDGSMYGGSAGGAITNTGNLDVIGGKFDSNKAYLGGALYNSGNASFKDTLFISNEATSTVRSCSTYTAAQLTWLTIISKT